MSMDNEQDNHSYLEEQALWNLVKKGDVESVRKLRGASYLRHPLVLENNPVKNEEYMAVSSITLLSRTVIEAGVPTHESFALSDLYLKRISECRSVNQLTNLNYDATLDFTLLVQKHMQESSPNVYIKECKKIISDSILKKTSLSDICRELGLQPTYLSRLFKSSEGQTVTEYIHRKKIEWACNMLKYSHKSVSEISLALQFNSQSYFGRIFKKYTGFTPQGYRQEFYIVDQDRPLSLKL